MIIQIRSPDAKSRDFYTRKQYFRCSQFISKQRCTVQGALWAKSTTSETELFPILRPLISSDQQAERQSACRWRYWKLCWCFELIWKASALNVSSQSCLRLKTALATTPRADVTTKMLKLLVRSTQISVQEQILNCLDLKVIESCHLHDFLLSHVFHGFLPWRWPPGLTCILGLVWWSW